MEVFWARINWALADDSDGGSFGAAAQEAPLGRQRERSQAEKAANHLSHLHHDAAREPIQPCKETLRMPQGQESSVTPEKPAYTTLSSVP